MRRFPVPDGLDEAKWDAARTAFCRQHFGPQIPEMTGDDFCVYEREIADAILAYLGLPTKIEKEMT